MSETVEIGNNASHRATPTSNAYFAPPPSIQGRKRVLGGEGGGLFYFMLLTDSF